MEASNVSVVATGNIINTFQLINVSCTNTTGLNETQPFNVSLSTPIIMTTLGVLGNVLALIVLYASRREAHARRTVFFVMLSGLAWTDLIGLFAVSPIAIITYANNLRWVGGDHLCRYHGFMMVSFGIVMPLIVCCMSVERFLAIKFSYYYARHITRRKAQLTFLTCWCVTISFTVLPFLGFGSYQHQFPGSWCFLNFHRQNNKDTIFAAIFSCLNIIAILVMIFCNLVVACTLFRLRRSRRLHSSSSIDRKLSLSCISSTTSGTVIRQRHHSDMEAQMIWFLGLITIAFSVCWLPLNVHILIMQFTGKVNRLLDLQFIRLVSCNQILDPWLYVIFRKNSLLRIMRRLKACYTGHREPPKCFPSRPPTLRYVMGNKSYICEPTTVLGERRYNYSPTLRRHLIGNCNHATGQHSSSGDTSDSVSRLVHACSYFHEISSKNYSNTCTGPSSTAPTIQINGINYTTSENVQYSFTLQQNTETLDPKTSDADTSESVQDVTTWKMRQKPYMKDLTSSAKEQDGIYNSLDTEHHQTTQSSPLLNNRTPISFEQNSPLAEPSMHVTKSKEVYKTKRDAPLTMKFALDHHRTQPPPLASSEQLLDTPFISESQAILQITEDRTSLTNESHEVFVTTSFQCSGHISTATQPRANTASHVTPQRSPLNDLCDNKLVPQCTCSNTTLTELAITSTDVGNYKHKLSNCASRGYKTEESQRSLSPQKTKPLSYPNQFCPLTTKMSHVGSVSDGEGKLFASVNHLTDSHKDHIKCFKAKKTIPLDRNGSVSYQTGIGRQFHRGDNGLLELPLGSSP